MALPIPSKLSKDRVPAVYLHLIEAKNLRGVDKSGTSDPYVRVIGHNPLGKKGDLWQSRTIKANCNPQWRQEVLIPVADSTETLMIKVIDENKVLRDKKIAVGKLDLAKLAPEGERLEMELDGGGTLYLCAKVMPFFCLDKWAPVRPLLPHRVYLDRLVYCPGERLRGYLISNMQEPQIARKIMLGVRGQIEVHGIIWKLDPQRHMMKELLHPNSFVEAPVKGSTLEAGLHVWAFEMVLPPDCLPTSKPPIGGSSSEFNLMFVVGLGDIFQLDYPHRIPFTVAPSLTLMEPKLYQGPRNRRPHHHAAIPFIHVKWHSVPRILVQDRKNTIGFDLVVDAECPGPLTRLALCLRSTTIIHSRLQPTPTDQSEPWYSVHTEGNIATTVLPIEAVSPGTVYKFSQSMEENWWDPNAISIPPGQYVPYSEIYHALAITARVKDEDVECGQQHPVFVCHSSSLIEQAPEPVAPDTTVGVVKLAKLTLDQAALSKLLIPGQDTITTDTPLDSKTFDSLPKIKSEKSAMNDPPDGFQNLRPNRRPTSQSGRCSRGGARPNPLGSD